MVLIFGNSCAINSMQNNKGGEFDPLDKRLLTCNGGI